MRIGTIFVSRPCVLDREALAVRVARAGPNLQSLLEHDDDGALVEIRRVQNLEIDSTEFDLGARLPDEVSSVDVGMQGANEDADPPKRPAATMRSQVSAMKLFGLPADLPPSISQSVSFCSSATFMTSAFAAQLQRASRRQTKRRHSTPG